MLRIPRPPVAAPLELPLDVRLTNGVANAVFWLAAVAIAAAALLWLTRAPVFRIRAIELGGELTRNSVSTIRANAMPRLEGNFFSLNLKKARAAFESVPWVRRAVVRRVWPNRIAVVLQEQRAAALWDGSDRSDRLVNSYGEVFEANVGDVEDDKLPSFDGPEGSAAAMLAMYRQLQPLFDAADHPIATLRLSTRGSWSVELDDEAKVEIGRGSDAEVLARCARFLRTLPRVVTRYNAPLESADLRYPDAYAVRLRGVTTKTSN
ncbi:MAG: cell division protein FtsQ/DivIB [Burkholderiales bacterium]|nr:cell division protein FtsQ/DivIB [Burkholderiales bacterium]MDE2394815.1 cell division protein FtsQ/DivIB [Burkholderiales bacterium]MDE2454934.1 cell division protein FtsQ/DivIB [Burkholderiales bacterium]